MPNSEVIEAMNWKDGIAFMILGAFIWHCIFSGMIALNGWRPTKRYAGSSTPEWPKHDRVHLKDPVKYGRVGPYPPPQPPTEPPRRA
ncbi:hypothetical protein BWI97_08675 [Siphonobacter sp. BAB-5405]|nr:hypothetical protein BWI97_08675 [Siphonobacter sp. BAB-5405]